MSLIFKMIPKIMRESGAVGKGHTNQQQGFKFRSIDDMYNALQSTLAANNVFTVPTILSRQRFDVVNAKGTKGQHVINCYRFKFYAEDGSFIEADADGESIDWGGDKASNKAASVAHKYALIQVFCIPTIEEKDTDTQTHEVKASNSPAKAKETAKPGQLQEAKPLPPFDLWHRDIDAARRYAKTIKETLMAKKSVPPNQKDFLQYGIVKGFFTETV